MTFWEVHGYFGGVFFLLFLLLLPRLTIFFSVSIWAVAAHVATAQLGLGGFPAWLITFVLSLIGWVAWIIFPRYVIAFAGMVLYFSTNPVLWVMAWTIAVALFYTQRTILRGMLAEAKKQAANRRAEHAKRQEEMRDAEERLKRMQEQRTKARPDASLDDLMRRIREQEAYMRRQRDEARRAASMRAQAKGWWEVLGVSKDASVESIKVAYRKIAKATHPDTAPDKKGDPTRFAEAAEAHKRALNEKKNGAM